jgi:UDP-glucuronate 4-epimerase
MATLITGAGGYVGLNIAEALLAQGRELVLFDAQLLPAIAVRALDRLPGRWQAVAGDVREAAALDEACGVTAIDGVIHCAAITSGPAREAREPGRVFEVNIGGTIAVLEAARRHGVRRCVLASSGAAYGESLYIGPLMQEDATPVLPNTLYGCSKYAAERTARRLGELWELDVVAARLGTVIGPWERDTGVRDNFGPHSQLARLALAGGEAVLPAEELTRDWVYSRDVAAGFVALLDAPEHAHGVYNLSAGLDWTGAVIRWCERLQQAFPDFRYRTARAGDTPGIHYTDRARFPMDVSRLTTDIGFRAPHAIDTAYDDFIMWLKADGAAWFAPRA